MGLAVNGGGGEQDASSAAVAVILRREVDKTAVSRAKLAVEV